MWITNGVHQQVQPFFNDHNKKEQVKPTGERGAILVKPERATKMVQLDNF